MHDAPFASTATGLRIPDHGTNGEITVLLVLFVKLSSVQISCGAPGHRGLYDFQQTQTKRRLRDHWVLFVQNGGKDEKIWLCLGTVYVWRRWITQVSVQRVWEA